MAQPNVAREPSMEEILASIRRIIESNDPTSDTAGLHGDPSAYDEDEIESFDEAAAFVPDAAANDAGLPRRPEFSVSPEPVSAPTAVVSEKSLSLADVAARVRAASARHQDMTAVRPVVGSDAAPSATREMPSVVAETTMQAAFREPPSPVIPLHLAELRPSFSTSVAPQSDSAAVIGTAARAADEVQHQLPVTPAQDVAVSETVEPAPVETLFAAVPVENEPQTAQAGTSLAAMAGLLSEAAGAQVAKSFGELADVFDGLERRSVEEMAQDMLRPMLQEWLDDNLPTLVERLVREEIERVARGPRR